MKSILERALVHLLNEENEKAEELLHQFVIETARDIHEKLRESDEEVTGEELDEEFFTEADLGDDAAEELEGDLGEEMPEEPEAADVSDDTLDMDGGDDMGGDDMDMGGDDMDMGGDDMGADAGSTDDVIADFEAQLDALKDKFEEIVAGMEGGDDVAAEVEGDDMTDVADAGDMGDMDMGDDEMDAGDDMDADVADEDEDFADITESVLDELQAVSAEKQEGKGANGENLLGNKQSLKFNKPEAKATNAQSTKRVGHTGYSRETAPSSQALKGGKTVVSTSMKNVRKDADNGNHKATSTSEGPKAILRKGSPDAAHAKGPISGKPVGKK